MTINLKAQLVEDIFFRMETIMDLNGMSSISVKDVETICEAYCKDSEVAVEDVIEDAEHHWQYLRNTMISDYDVVVGNVAV